MEAYCYVTKNSAVDFHEKLFKLSMCVSFKDLIFRFCPWKDRSSQAVSCKIKLALWNKMQAQAVVLRMFIDRKTGELISFHSRWAESHKLIVTWACVGLYELHDQRVIMLLLLSVIFIEFSWLAFLS